MGWRPQDAGDGRRDDCPRQLDSRGDSDLFSIWLEVATRSDLRDLDGRIGERLDVLAARLDRFLES
jgi:hypothetical protein